jgi:hypothetical protein
VAAPGVEIALAGNVSHDRGAGLFRRFRGKGRADRPADDADGAGELHPAGVDVSPVAASQISLEMARCASR